MLDPLNSTNCELAEEVVTNLYYNIVRWIHLFLSFTIVFLLLPLLLYFYKHNPVPLHKNLKLVLINILIINAILPICYIMFEVRYLIIYFTYTDPCECLTPVGLALILRVPQYQYLVASPIAHLSMLLERVRATILSKNYEKEGIKPGIIKTILIWTLTMIFTVYLILEVLEDPDNFGKPLIYISLTSSKNARLMIVINYLLLVFLFGIAIADYWIIVKNRNMRKKKHDNYDLSQNYQVNENILTMRLIFPLDFTYVIFYTIFILFTSYIRIVRDTIGSGKYMLLYEFGTTIPLILVFVSLIVYIYFIHMMRSRRRTNVVEPLADHTDIYFKQFATQLGF